LEAQSDLLGRVRSKLERNKLFDLYPDKGPLRRELYPKHQAFLAAGRTHSVRMMMAANRVGKTEGCALYEVALHMTGKYPSWWEGRRFTRPVRVWVCGDTGKTLREILQVKLLGAWANFGTGLIPADDLLDWKNKSGVAESIDTFTVRHVSGGKSHGVFKSYESGRIAFQGSEQDIIVLDEEPPLTTALDIYSECITRTMTTDGLVMLTFTPLFGMTKLIKHMRESHVWEIGATWDDVPHLSQEAKEKLWASYPPHMRDARSKGIPQRGSGVVFPVSEHTITVEPFIIPAIWPCIGGLDFGWDHPSAAAKLAHDRDNDTIYVVGTYREREKTPLEFAAGVRSWGKWLPWAWPADGLRKDKDPRAGKQLAQLYRDEGLSMLPEPASFSDEKLEHSLNDGVIGMLTMMQAGRFKVMAHLTEWFIEFRDYYRKDGVIVAEAEDLMCATRYAWMMRRHARVKPSKSLGATPANWRTV
jgi:phage terminase large subunit-like protein